MLNRNIQIGTDIIHIRQHVQQGIVCFIGIAVQNPEPVHTVNGGGFFHQIRQGGVGMIFRTVAGGILGDQDMLPDTGAGKGPDFPENGLFIPAAVWSADHRNGTEGAAVGAAFADPDIG